MAAPDDITGPINLGNPVETSVAELADLIIALTGSRSTIVRRPLPVDDPVQRCPDIAQAEAVLGWQPAHRAQGRPDAHHRLFRQASLHAGAQTRSRPASERDIAGQRGNRGKLTRASRGVAEPIAVG